MPFTGGRTIILGNMDVDNLVPAGAHRRRQILLFDVGVKRVVHHLQIRMICLATEPGVIRCICQKIALKPIQVLANQRDLIVLSVVGGMRQDFESPLPLVAGRSGSAERP